jgi:hypothetical protein
MAHNMLRIGGDLLVIEAETRGVRHRRGRGRPRTVAAPTSGPSEVIVGTFGGTVSFGQSPFTASEMNGSAFVAWWVP